MSIAKRPAARTTSVHDITDCSPDLLADKATQRIAWETSFTLDHLQENNRRNQWAAALLDDDFPEVASELRKCCRYVQWQKNAYWQPAYRCRQQRVCANCHMQASRLIQEQFVASCHAFATEFQLQTRMVSFVMHLQLPEDTPRDRIINASADAIMRFGDHLKDWRSKTNVLLRHRLRPQWIPKNKLIGPMLLSSHVRPVGKNRRRFHAFRAYEDMHLHVLACLPKNARINQLQTQMERLWHRSQLTAMATTEPIAINIKHQNLYLETQADTIRFIGYIARHIRTEWSYHQAVHIFNLVRQLPRSSMLRLFGRSQPRRKLSHRTPIRGDAMRYSYAKQQFVPVFLEKWK